MTTLAQLADGRWILTYELGLPDQTFPVHYRIAEDPEEFRHSETIPLVTREGRVPNGAPTVAWSSSGGPQGTIIVSDADAKDFFVNRQGGDPGAWTLLSSSMPAGYSRYVVPLERSGAEQPEGQAFVVTGPTFHDAPTPRSRT